MFPAGLIACVVGAGLYFDHSESFAVARIASSQEFPMNERSTGKRDETGKAKHGPRNEVNWEGGSGRQPYGNQGNEEAAEPNGGDHVAEGNRGDRSGRNLDQMGQARGKP